MTERERAFQLLQRIERESAYASIVLQDETGFVRTLVLGILRWRSRLDDAIEKLASRRLGKLDANVVDILRIGIYQLMFMDVAPYAAVSETVDLAGRYAKRARGFVNAILRSATQTDLHAFAADLATRTAHPKWLLDRWTRGFGAERAAKIAEANQELSYPDVFTSRPPAGALPSMLVPGIFKLSGSSANVEGYALDEGSGVIADIAAATSNDILDLAAAPGGKTIVMTARGANVVSNDISIARIRPLAGRSRRIVISDGRQPPFRRKFETVLLDAPCSATGIIRKNPEIKWRLREADFARFAILQRELLAAAVKYASKYVIYSTCSLEPEENDDVVAGSDRDDVAEFANAEVAKWVQDGVLRLTPESGADGFTAFVLQVR
ncbi:MAG TPA: transcription antitermination factor NusB [Thermoanaerobaculia bacterium]|nr:transcription antitermination factor NusB [Thermoanaerobaculia bacterium]